MIHLVGLLFSSIITGYAFFASLNALYEKKYIAHKTLYIFALLGYISLSVIVVWIGIPTLNLVYSFFILYIISKSLYQSHGKNVLINSGVIIVYFSIVDMIATTIFSTFLGHNTYDILHEPLPYILSSAGNAIIILCTNKFLIQCLQHCQMSKASSLLHAYMIFLMIFELWTLCYLVKFFIGHNVFPLLISIGFVVIDAGILYLYSTLSKKALLEKKTELAEQQLEMTVKYYEDFLENHERTQKKLHDIKKHLQILKVMNTMDKTCEQEYTEEILQSLDDVHQQFQCDDKIISAIIWNKKQICEDYGIEFQTDIKNSSFEFMTKMEITALFANLLDNAIESCLDSKSDKKTIILRIHRFKDYIVIKLLNSLGSKPRLKEGKLISTKAGHLGMGMSIIENLVEKYCGNLKYNYTEDFFETNIILFSKK